MNAAISRPFWGLLLIVVAVAGFFFADQSVQTELIAQMRALVGDQGAALHDLLHASMGTLLIWEAINLFGMTTALIGLIFKYLPDAAVPWRDVWMGAIVTALLFAVGKWLRPA